MLLLCQALVHPISNLRKEAALALGEIADLADASNYPDPGVRKAAHLAVKRISLPHNS